MLCINNQYVYIYIYMYSIDLKYIYPKKSPKSRQYLNLVWMIWALDIHLPGYRGVVLQGAKNEPMPK